MSETVSVIMPSYNTGEFIAASIQSVLSQTHTDFELIIVDDCSTDNTEEIVAGFNDERIKFFKNDTNSGAAFSRNRALRIASGKWVAFLDSDDIWYPEKLEKQIDFMKNNGYRFSYTAYEEINADGSAANVIIDGPVHITKAGMYRYCWPGCLTVMYDRGFVGEIQIENIRKNNDYAMWLKVSQKAECYLLNEILAKYRRGRSGSISTNSIINMIGWHYKLFRVAQKQNVVCAIFSTGRNLIFGFIKKIKYVKRIGE